MNRLLVMLAMVIACDIDEIFDYLYDNITLSDVLTVSTLLIGGLLIYTINKSNRGK